ncbi:MAG: zinc-dependent peptidase [Flavobacteriaceae bacterium]
MFSLIAIFKNWHRIVLFPKKFNSTQRTLISSNSQFYSNLTLTNKKYFEHRVLSFIESYEFVSRERVKITEEIKLLIAASAIKLTFGYRHYIFSSIDTIIVYPKDYFSPFGNQQHKGETNLRYKVIVFSLQDFKEGIKIVDDNLNLGLHEFTHAMHYSFMSSGNSSASYFKKHYSNLLEFMKDKSEQKKLVNAGYLREYAFENQFEFLAVLVEHFFETPDKFEQKLPELFFKIKKLLNYSKADFFS